MDVYFIYDILRDRHPLFGHCKIAKSKSETNLKILTLGVAKDGDRERLIYEMMSFTIRNLRDVNAHDHKILWIRCWLTHGYLKMDIAIKYF